jgi:dolichyl-phosphate beta-glucosyltransferase
MKNVEVIDSGLADAPAKSAVHPAPLTMSLVIPAFNEEARLEAGLTRLTHAITHGAIVPESTQFIVVDDGSTDGTSAAAGSLLNELPHVEIIRLEVNSGKGSAVRAGVAAASAPIIAFADADMAIDPVQTPQFIAALARADLAIGSRTATGSSVDSHSFSRSMMSRTFNHVANAVTGVSLNDTQCGFKFFRAPAAKLLFHCTVTHRMAFDVELLSLARRLGLSIVEVPVHWSRIEGSSVRSWTDSPAMLRDVLRSRKGTDDIPRLSGISITLPDPENVVAHETPPGETYLANLSAYLPVIRQSSGHFLALCPLMNEAAVALLAQDLTRHLNGSEIRRTEITMAGVRSMAPLTLTWDDASISTKPC